MKNQLLQIFILLILLLNSCVSIKPAKTFDKAENKIITLNKGIQNQIERYPSLVKEAYTYTIIDTIFIEGAIAEFEATLIRVDSLNNLVKEYQYWVEGRDELIDSLMNIPLSEYPIGCQFIVEELINKNKTISKELLVRNKELTKVFTSYQEELNKRIAGFYEDSIFKVDYEYYKGNIIIKPTVKDKYKLYDKVIVTNSIKIKKHFWQDFKFYLFLTGLITLFYYFNNLFYNILDSIFTGIKHFVRKIFTKF